MSEPITCRECERPVGQHAESHGQHQWFDEPAGPICLACKATEVSAADAP